MNEGRRRAILIAASEFPEEHSLQTLRCSKNDVTGLAEALTSPDFGLFADPLTFINAPSHSTLRAINRAFKEASRNDQILIYYSGHGKPDAAGHLHLATSDTEADALETSSIAVGTLRRLIDNCACKQVALILDCCFGGAVGKDFLKSGVDDHLKQTFHGRGIYILTASTAVQTAREKEGDDYSLFTKHILQGIRQGEADHDDDGLISLDDLYEYVKTRVPKEAPQYPTKWEFGVQGNSLFIARAIRTFSPERLRAFKQKIKDNEDYLLPEVFMQAYRVISDNRPKRDKNFFALLEELCDGRVRHGEFISRWMRLSLPREPEQETKAIARNHQSAPELVRSKKPDLTPSLTENLNGVRLEMVLLPGGSFEMGSPENESDNSEWPQHEVTVPSFYIGKYQITLAQWQAVMGEKRSPFEGGGNLPVEWVAWDDAKEFCRKLSRMTGKEYRLPSEAEWEYACRAQTRGNYAGSLGEMAWYINNSGLRWVDVKAFEIGEQYSKHLTNNENSLHPVGQKQPNDFGLYDMHGNVWEWCEDVWHDNYDNAPNDGSAWLNEGDWDCRVLRGGSWSSPGSDCRSAFRLYSDSSDRKSDIGFRVVVSARIS